MWMRATALCHLSRAARHPGTGGGSGVTVSGSGSNTLVLSGFPGCHQCLARRGVTYQGEQDFNGQDALTMVTNDLGSTPAAVAPERYRRAAYIEVEPVNDAPVTQVPGSLQVKEDGSLSLTRDQREGRGCWQRAHSMVLRVERRWDSCWGKLAPPRMAGRVQRDHPGRVAG